MFSFCLQTLGCRITGITSKIQNRSRLPENPHLNRLTSLRCCDPCLFPSYNTHIFQIREQYMWGSRSGEAKKRISCATCVLTWQTSCQAGNTSWEKWSKLLWITRSKILIHRLLLSHWWLCSCVDLVWCLFRRIQGLELNVISITMF